MPYVVGSVSLEWTRKEVGRNGRLSGIAAMKGCAQRQYRRGSASVWTGAEEIQRLIRAHMVILRGPSGCVSRS